jgi:sterol desaturase/sphingolipid hydroxylase (fatty acid hydroxylase superfamily)
MTTSTLTETILPLVISTGQSVIDQLPELMAVGVAFTLLGFVTRSKATTGPWWKKPDLVTDLLFCFLLPAFTSYARLAFLIVGAGLITGLSGTGSIESYLTGGSGIFSGMGFWTQMVIYLVLSDVMLYWTHRIFHDAKLWRYHAVHHSSEHLDWISAFRFHPINIIFHSVLVDCVMLLAGVAPGVMVALVPFQLFMSALVHADVDWDFGPFKYVIASPMFHRWHHTDVARGGEKNFAPTFPLIDVIFGTFYMPKGVVPDHFGVDDPDYPQSFEQQLLYPFTGDKKAAEAKAG